MPRGVYPRRLRAEVRAEVIAGKAHISQIRHDAVMSRWESVQKEKEMWMLPFHKLDVERALRYLEDLRIVCAEAGAILNERINAGTKIKCSGPNCGKDLTGLKPNGLPKWIAKKDFKDLKNPEIFHCLYFCSSLCDQEFIRSQVGEAPDAHGKENRRA
jgi:hypothetical protein